VQRRTLEPERASQAADTAVRPRRVEGRGWSVEIMFSLVLSTLYPRSSTASTAAEQYDPSWADQFFWTTNNLYNRPPGVQAYLEDNYVPWWQGQVAHPVADYDAAKLATGGVRLDM